MSIRFVGYVLLSAFRGVSRDSLSSLGIGGQVDNDIMSASETIYNSI